MSEEVQIAERAAEAASSTTRLDRFMADDASATPQSAAAAALEAGGVAAESQPVVVKEALAVEAASQQGSESDILVPEDVVPTSKPKSQEAPPPATTVHTEESMPEDVKRSPKKAQDAWAAAKRSEKQAKQEAETLRKELETLRSQSKPSDETAALKRQLEEAENRLGQVDLANSRTFKQQFDDKINDTYRKSVQLLVQQGHDAEEAKSRVKALLTPGVTQEELVQQLSDLPPILQGQLYTGATEMRSMQESRSQALKEWRATQAAAREEEARQQQTITQQLVAENLDTAIESLRAEGSFLFAKSNDDNWNRQVEERINAAKGIIAGPTDVLAKYVAEGVAAKVYRALYMQERNKAQRYKADMDQLASGRPIIGRDPGTEAPVQAEQGKRPRNPDSFLDEHLT